MASVISTSSTNFFSTGKITGGEELTKQQLSKIKCSGAALENGKINVTNEILVDTKESGVIGGLSVKMEGQF